jgi:predicted NBD/HSP70 family sugar kinase
MSRDPRGRLAGPLPTASRAVAIDVLVHGAQSRTQLAKKMGLSPATLTRLVRPLVESGVLVEGESVRSAGRGRSSVALDVVADDYRFVGVKLTSDSIYAVLTNLRAEVLASETIAEPSLAVPDVVAAVTDLVRRLEMRAGRAVHGVGVTVGGQVDDGETVADSPFLHWHEVPFRTLLAEGIAAPLFLANDVVGLTKAQQWFGLGRTYSDFALLTVGAGVGYGLVVNHDVIPTLVSPISHLPIDAHGPLCHWGHRGCLSAYVTSGAMCAAVSATQGRAVTYEQVLRSAEDGEPVARRVVSEAAHALGRATAAITSLTGVERVILSGEGVRLAEVGRGALAAGRLEYLDHGAPVMEPVIRPMDFLEWARGAAVIAIQRIFP